MFERFSRESRHAVERAAQTARRLGAARVEPEHLLLALAAGDGRADRAALALAEAGLDAEQIEDALERELVAALGVVGVPASVVASAPIYPSAAAPRFGLAIKAALEQALRELVLGDGRRLGTEHLLLGLLDAPAPGLRRVLAELDVEPDRLAALVRVELAAGR